MRNPEQVLNILSEHGKESDYKYERLYRILFNEQMFYVAYQRIYAKSGTMTPGTDGKTEDEMSIERINKLIKSIKDETYSPQPAKCDNLPYLFKTPSLSLTERLTAKTCELCGKHREVVMHHVHTLKGLKGKYEWEDKMLRMYRKTLAVCMECNANIQSCDKK